MSASESGNGARVNGQSVSPRETQVVKYVARGFTYTQIANRLGISVHTVNTYIRRVRQKCEVETHADIVRLGILLTNDMGGSGTAAA
ncbi:response regulator transcription factor [Streptomyces koyangensis]|uniref:response regulator transcription factor n=1 Tax=Streptomyces koyangensis TaxID=188770 RepID=UPI00286F8384|nr:helix-turn-helix transcriptional regulator [Streptomyces koyangensis]